MTARLGHMLGLSMLARKIAVCHRILENCFVTKHPHFNSSLLSECIDSVSHGRSDQCSCCLLANSSASKMALPALAEDRVLVVGWFR